MLVGGNQAIQAQPPNIAVWSATETHTALKNVGDP
jgi:hypothetical protein